MTNRVTLDEYNNQLLKAYQSDKALQNRIKESRNLTSAFQIQQAEILKPLVDPIKKMADKERVEKADERQPQLESQGITEEEVMEMIENGDDNLFGITKFDDDLFRLGIYERFSNLKDSKGGNPLLLGDHWFEFDYDTQLITVYRTTLINHQQRHKDKNEYSLSYNLMLYLTQDITTTYIEGSHVDDTSKEEYLDIINFCIGNELEKLKKMGRWKGRSDLMDEFRKIKKFKDFIGKKYHYKGMGYREMAQYPIVISPDKATQMNRLLVLLGSNKAGNDNPDGLAEYTAILDEQLKSGIIPDKRSYKLMLYKYMNK